MKTPAGGLGGETLLRGPGAEPLLECFSAARRGTIKSNIRPPPDLPPGSNKTILKKCINIELFMEQISKWSKFESNEW